MNEIYICRTCRGETEYYYDDRWDNLVAVKNNCTCWDKKKQKPAIKPLDLAFEKITAYMTIKEKLNYE